MSDHSIWVVSFAGVRVPIIWHGKTSRDILRFLFGATCENISATARQEQLRIQDIDGKMTVFRGNKQVYQGRDAGVASGILLDWTVHDLAYDCHLGPLFHAGALDSGGRGILLPGESGAGKSTLSAWLARQGYNFLSDELACIEPGSNTLHAFERPIHLREPTVEILEKRGDLQAQGDRDSFGPARNSSGRGHLVRSTELNPRSTYSIPEVRLIVFPRYDVKHEGCGKRLTPAKAATRLMECLVNARNFTNHGFREVTHLVRRVPAYALTFSDLTFASTIIEEWLDAESAV